MYLILFLAQDTETLGCARKIRDLSPSGRIPEETSPFLAASVGTASRANTMFPNISSNPEIYRNDIKVVVSNFVALFPFGIFMRILRY